MTCVWEKSIVSTTSWTPSVPGGAWDRENITIIVWLDIRATPFVKLLRAGESVDCGRLSDPDSQFEDWGNLDDCDYLSTALSEFSMTAQRVRWIHDTNAVITTTVIPNGVPVYNDDTGRWHIGDGITAGGNPMAKLSETVTFQQLLGLPTTLPDTQGQLWWNFGVLSLS